MGVFSKNIGADADLDPVDEVKLPSKEKLKGLIAPNGTLILESIKSGDVFTHDGPVVVSGTIGSGAKVNITNGSLTVGGDVENDVEILVEYENWHPGDFHRLQERNGSMLENYNLKRLSESVRKDFNEHADIDPDAWKNVSKRALGILIEGHIWHDVTLKADGDICVNSAGNKLTIHTKRDFLGNTIGPDAYINAKMDVDIATLGEHSKVEVGQSYFGRHVHNDSIIVAEDSVSVVKVYEDVGISAVKDLHVQNAHVSSRLSSGKGPRVAKTYGSYTVHRHRVNT